MNLAGLSGLAGIFVTMVIENMGVPFPTEASYLWAVAMIERGYSYLLLFSVLTAGHLVGAIAAYFIGYWGEGVLARRFIEKPAYTKASDWLQKWFARYGSLTIFATRLIGWVRPWSSLAAGFAHIGFAQFLFWTIVGTLLFNWIVLEFTLRFIDLFTRLGPYFKIGSITLFILSFCVIFIFKYILDRKARSSENG